ncbi:hypothetical protein C922_02009 [Plasmodium inui San Antonio 1]|uniref:G domain-containing protein n=1 Tax=Plasmodium inui San Antonio 1 TaxID=1237626 RepID=W7A814_9APIC|nr:hypothetical protein C922_02009 [Plasmodium inui San Antonio 1]EUD67820.1 hypothetical protein C922_02009 [Plasmodium inui San Antonio 1]
MFLKLAVFFLVHVFITCKKCHSYFLKNKYFENVFFVNSHIRGFSKNDEKKAVKIQRNRKRGVFYFPQKICASGRRGVHRWARQKGGNSSTRCFFKSNGGVALFPRNGNDSGGNDAGETHLSSPAAGDCTREKRGSKLFSENFERVFKENFDESCRMKKSELISILACICTNIVIEFLKIREEKKTEHFDYPFDYSLMNILKLVNFEYDVNEELQKKRKKQKREFSRRKFKGRGVEMGTMGEGIVRERGSGRDGRGQNETGKPHLGGPLNEGGYEETEEEVNINIDNKNTKEENEKLDEYIKMMEFNTMEIKHIEPYIDLFFGKETFQKVFVKNGIDIHKIYDKLSEALFDKCQEKANVMELQKFVQHEERNMHKKKKIHVRNASTSFDQYMEGLGSLEESRGVSEVERILYHGEVPSDGEFTSDEECTSEVATKKRKKKTRGDGNIINGLNKSGQRDGDHLGVDLGDGPETDGDSPDGGSSSGGGSHGGSVDRSDDTSGDSSGGPGVEDSPGSTDQGSQDAGGEGRRGGQEDFSGREDERRQEGFQGREEHQEGRSARKAGMEFLNGISYALINKETKMEEEGDPSVEIKSDASVEDPSGDAEGKPQGNVVLIKFVYDNKYACEFRTDLGVIAYEGVGTKSPDDIKEGIKKMYNRVSGGDVLSDSDLIRGGAFKGIFEEVNFEELYEMPYKKRFARKQSIIREMNGSVVAKKGVCEIDAYPLLYGYLKVWEEDLHCYELKKVEISHICGVEPEEKKGGENVLSGKMKYSFFRNYDEKENDQMDGERGGDIDDVLIDSDRYRQIVRANEDRANGKIYHLLGEGDFSNNDYISFKDKLFVNNRKEINCYEDLITKLRCNNSNLSVTILSRLDRIKQDLCFVSGEEFLKNYTFDEEDQFFNFDKIVHRCLVESRYCSMFGREGDGLKGGERNFKLSCHRDGFSGGKRRESAFWNVRERNVFVPQVRNGMTHLPPRLERALSIDAKVSAEESWKKKQERGRKKKKKHAEDADLVSSEKEEKDPFSDEMDEDLLRFENIDNIMELHGEGDERNSSGSESNTTDLFNDEVTSQVIEKLRRQQNRSHEKSKNYLEKMLERQRGVNDFLSLEKAQESVKKNLSVVNYEEAFKQLKSQLKGKSNRKRQASGYEGAVAEDARVEETGLSDADDKEIERQIKGILKGKNLNEESYRLDRSEGRGAVDTEEPTQKEDQKQDEEKKKIEEFFKNMRIEVKLSRDMCVGCGIPFQSSDQKRFGFLKRHVYERVVSRDEGFDKREILRHIYQGGTEEKCAKEGDLIGQGEEKLFAQLGSKLIHQLGGQPEEQNRKQKLLGEFHKLRGEAISKVVQLGRADTSQDGSGTSQDRSGLSQDGSGISVDGSDLYGGVQSSKCDSTQGKSSSIIQVNVGQSTGEETNEEKKFYLCERCFNLRYKNDIKENMIINYTNKNEISAQDFEKYVINIFKKRCFIIYIVDILDLYIYSNLRNLFFLYKMHSDKGKSEGFFFCINKVDLLPDYKEFTVKNYVHNFLRSNKINVPFRNIFLVSAKTGYNVKNLIYTVYVRSRVVRKRGKRRRDGGRAESGHGNEGEANKGEANKGEANKGETNKGEVKGDDDYDEVDGDYDEVDGDYDEVDGDYDEVDGDSDHDDSEVDGDEVKRAELGELAPPGEASSKKNKFFLKNVNIYIVGNANSGKSSLINYLLKNVKKKDNQNFQISNSIIPGTTLKNIQIKLSKHITINDTPGIISSQSLLSCLNFDEMKYVVCTKLKKKVSSMYINKNDYIFIGGLVYLHILNIKKYYAIMSFFMSEKIPIIKRKNFSKDAGKFLREKISSGFLYPPFSVERFDQLNNFKDCYFNITNPCVDRDSGSYDIHIQGLGYITFYSFENIEFYLYTLKNVDVVSRSSLMPYHKRYGKLNISRGEL